MARQDPRQMNGGYQLSMFDTEPEPATQAGPALGPQSPIGDCRQPAAVDDTALTAYRQTEQGAKS